MQTLVTEKQATELKKLANKNGYTINDYYLKNGLIKCVYFDSKNGELYLLSDEDQFGPTNTTYEKIKKLLSRKLLRTPDSFLVTKLKHGVQIGCKTIKNEHSKAVLAYLDWLKTEPKLPEINGTTLVREKYGFYLGSDYLNDEDILKVAKFAGLKK